MTCSPVRYYCATTGQDYMLYSDDSDDGVTKCDDRLGDDDDDDVCCDSDDNDVADVGIRGHAL